MVTPNLLEANIYSLDSQSISFLKHGSRTLIGSDDNVAIAKPDMNVAQDQIDLMIKRVAKLAKTRLSDKCVSPVACIKVDIANSAGLTRNLDIEIVTLKQNVLCAFPGKMTGAPFMSDLILGKVLTQLNRFTVAPRPLDEVKFTELDLV